MKNKERKEVEKELDRLWSKAVRERDKYQCQWCLYDGLQKAGNEPHHIIPRSRSKALRWVIENGVTLCYYCHNRKLLDYPVEFAQFIKVFLEKQNYSYEMLKQNSKKLGKFSIKELNKLREKLIAYIVKGYPGEKKVEL